MWKGLKIILLVIYQRYFAKWAVMLIFHTTRWEIKN